MPTCKTCRYWQPEVPPMRHHWMTDEQWAEAQATFAATPPATYRHCGYAATLGSLIDLDDSACGFSTHESFGCNQHQPSSED